MTVRYFINNMNTVMQQQGEIQEIRQACVVV